KPRSHSSRKNSPACPSVGAGGRGGAGDWLATSGPGLERVQRLRPLVLVVEGDRLPDERRGALVLRALELEGARPLLPVLDGRLEARGDLPALDAVDLVRRHADGAGRVL